MDKVVSSNDSSTSSCSSSSAAAIPNRDMFLKQINRNSVKIAKPLRKPLLPSVAASIPEPNPHNPPQSQQPPVYNINKNDFRDVVQKLTGSPAHERLPTPPPPVNQARAVPSSRLQRIRPPPLAQISNRPPQVSQLIQRPQNDIGQRFVVPQAQGQSFQPLPPLPSVHPAAESPISAYMRFLQSSTSSPAPSSLWNSFGPRPDSLVPQNEFGPRPPLPPAESPVSAYMRFLQSPSYFSSAASPRGNAVAQPPPPQAHPQHPAPPQQQQPPLPSSAAPSSFPPLPMSPLPFGCIPSPRSPYGMISPNFLFSPTGQLGLPQLPLSPTLPVPSPRWKGI